MANLIEIDGSTLEGGGQILRLSVAFSALLKKPVRVFNIRGGRENGGLKPQHLEGLKLASSMCNGCLMGGELGSTEITFHPGDIQSGTFYADTKTAGSVTLLLQVALPIAWFGPSTAILELKGGTNCEMAPPVDYYENVFHYLATKFSGNFKFKVLKRGFFPKGGGEINVSVRPVKSLSSATITDFGMIQRVSGTSYVAGVLPMKVADEMANPVERIFNFKVPESVVFELRRAKFPNETVFGNGSGINLFATTSTHCLLGTSGVGKKELKPSNLGAAAANELFTYIQNKVCVDDHAQDQIILLMALATGTSSIRCGAITKHTQTAIFVAEKFTGVKFNIHEQIDGGCNIIECEGIGFRNSRIDKK